MNMEISRRIKQINFNTLMESMRKTVYQSKIGKVSVVNLENMGTIMNLKMKEIRKI